MRYAILSDIHGNAPALRLALSDARKMGAEGLLFAGDYCTDAPWGSEVAGLMMELPRARVVSGNGEAYFRPGSPLLQNGSGQFEAARWTARQLSDHARAWLTALPSRLDWAESGLTFCMTHRHRDLFPEGVMHRYLATSSVAARFPQGVAHEAYLADVRQLLQQDEGLHAALPGMADVLIFGHTHGQWHAFVDGHLLINPGSCGEPLDGSGFAVCYTLLDIADGRTAVTERRLPMDVEALIRQAKATAQYAEARVWSELIFHGWRTTRDSIAPFLRFAEEYAEAIHDPIRPITRETWYRAFSAWTPSTDAREGIC